MLYCDDCGTISDKNYGPEDGSVRCPGCAGATEEATATSGLSLLDEPRSLQGTGLNGGSSEISDLDLFSTETIAKKRAPRNPDGNSRLRLIEDDVETPIEKNDSIEDRQIPVPLVPRQWRFECLACSGSLRIEPVTSRSKIRCPRCQTWMIVAANGEVNLPPTDEKKPISTPEQQTGAPEPSDPQRPPSVPTPDDEPAETDLLEEWSLKNTLSGASLRAVEAVEMQEGGSADTITLSPPTEQIAAAEEIEDALGFLGDDPHFFGEDFDLDAEIEPHTDETEETRENRTELTIPTIALWTGLFAVPSLVALLLARSTPSSGIYQALSRVGVSFQQSCGDLFTSVSGWIAGL